MPQSISRLNPGFTKKFDPRCSAGQYSLHYILEHVARISRAKQNLRSDSGYAFTISARYTRQGVHPGAKGTLIMGTKERLVLEILERNPSASVDWLKAFSEEELKDYLQHLCWSCGPREEGWCAARDERSVA